MNWVTPFLHFGVLFFVSAGWANIEPTYSTFADIYVGYDTHNKVRDKREYTTQPVRVGSPDLNLAYVDAAFAHPTFRARLALQAGSSVDRNYSDEYGKFGSGANPLRHIQEAIVGFQAGERLWLDGGIYLSHIGAESFISKNNFNYTRSMVADFSPYYQSGVRVSYEFSQDLQFQLHFLNGWQNISKTADSLAVGTQALYKISESTNLTYNTFFGDVGGARQFHDIIFSFAASDIWRFVVQWDFGIQQIEGISSRSHWSGVSFLSQFSVSDKSDLSFRIEWYSDPDKIVVSTAPLNGFSVSSLSLGYDFRLLPLLKWRNEIRHYWSKEPIFYDGDVRHDDSTLFVTAMSFSY